QLQLADYITLQALWRIDGSARGDNRIKKSLEALIGKLPIGIERFSADNFAAMIQMHENVENGRPIDEGVDSKLKVLVSCNCVLWVRSAQHCNSCKQSSRMRRSYSTVRCASFAGLIFL